jgi:hypothetical protein
MTPSISSTALVDAGDHSRELETTQLKNHGGIWWDRVEITQKGAEQ